MSRSVLIVEDDRLLAKNLSTYLARHGYDVQQLPTGSAALTALKEFQPDLALIDLNLPDMSGIELLTRIRQAEPAIQVIMMTGTGSVQPAVDAMKAGAADYLTKPLVLKELEVVLERTIEESRRAGALSYYQEREAGQSGLDKIIGESPPMRELKRRIAQFVAAEQRLSGQQPPTVLVTGETGTGKELVARAFHFEGPRRDQPFVELNCAAIPPSLLEAELFGYERGAFTDAKQRKLGLVDTANRGTLFLDEIGEMDPALQAKLLTLLENRRVRRIGSIQEHDVDVRIVAATNRDLEALVAAGTFRSDLYYRLRVIQVALPALRERAGDVPLLAQAFLETQGQRYGHDAPAFTPTALAKLSAYSWPGNIRELRNVVEQAVLMAASATIDAEHLLINDCRDTAQAPSQAPGGTTAAQPADDSLDLEQHEIRLLKQAMERTGGNVTKAARLLGLSRDTLRYRLAKYHLQDD